MDYQTISQLIGTLGFPIFACIAIYYQMIQQDKKHEEEMKSVREALERNTQAILELTTLFRERGDLDADLKYRKE